MRLALASTFFLAVCLAHGDHKALTNYRPTALELVESYKRADRMASREFAAKACNVRLALTWLDDGARFWYRKDLPGNRREFLIATSATGKKEPAFDHGRLAAALSKSSGKEVLANALPFREIEFIGTPKAGAMRFDIQGQVWEVDLSSYELKKLAIARPPDAVRPPWRQSLWEPQTRPAESPDKSLTARIVDRNVVLKNGDQERVVTKSGSAEHYFSRLTWSPDSKRLAAVRVSPGDRKQVHLIESSPREGFAARLMSRIYDRPGDKVDTFDIYLLDANTGEERAIEAEPVDYGSLPQIRWTDGTHFTYEKMDRGYGRWRLIEVDATSGKSRALIDEDPDTFVDSTSLELRYCASGEVIWTSERDGWNHLYLLPKSGEPVRITKGPWVVRTLISVDEKARQIVFGASGMHPSEDPYNIHYFRVNFDGSGLLELTPDPGHHLVQFSTDQKWCLDTVSTVNSPSVHQLRSGVDGHLVTELERADISELVAAGWKAPEPFLAKGRDGRTDIYGVVYWPTGFDPGKRYAVIEDIYAGPHDSFVPKAFSAIQAGQPLAELGFVVVKIDGMGTRNRGKAFHDVCYKNLADAGFPDRILWMQALGRKYPNLDLARVGVYGTSAGGQSSTGAMLFHPEFYKVAVSSCGCHDNRLDKIWWNEQWMGLIGPHYAEQSNITNAAKLRGHLLLLVGELDDNVPPESTYRLADALIKADREFELVVLPGLRHTGGGAFGERKRRDFFVRHLLGVEPPARNIAIANLPNSYPIMFLR